MNLRFHFIFIISYLANLTSAWELELYDLVEELDVDFYSLLGVERSADSKDIRQAFKKLSLVLHPDKNSAEDAHTKFRQLVAVHEVLRDPEKRLRYNDVLDNGLPDWRHAVYYYRRVRKMGMMEMLTILFGIVTIGQYLVGWASYLEKKFIAEEMVSTERKRLMRKQRKGKIDEVPDMTVEIPTPSVWNTLPFQLPKFIWRTTIKIPMAICFVFRHLREIKNKREPEPESEEEVEVWTKNPRRRRHIPLPEGKLAPEGKSVPKKVLKEEEDEQLVETPKVISGGLWTDDDFAELIRLVKKYPPGTAQRWEKIAETMNRGVAEVIHMAKKVKDGLSIKAEPDEIITEEKIKEKTRGGKLGEQNGIISEWTQVQQKALEEALVKFPKNVSERWDRIARAVPDKSKEECMLRYKYIAETLKKRKEEATKSQTN